MDVSSSSRKLSAKQAADQLATFKLRSETNTRRHKGIEWADVAKRLDAGPGTLCVKSGHHKADPSPAGRPIAYQVGALVRISQTCRSHRGRHSY